MTYQKSWIHQSREDIIAEVVGVEKGKWPAELNSPQHPQGGCMFYKGERITKTEFCKMASVLKRMTS